MNITQAAWILRNSTDARIQHLLDEWHTYCELSKSEADELRLAAEALGK